MFLHSAYLVVGVGPCGLYPELVAVTPDVGAAAIECA